MTGTPPIGNNVFQLRVGYDQDELLGARWWQDNLRASFAAPQQSSSGTDASRRVALQILFGVGGLALFGAFGLSRCSSRSSYQSVTKSSLQLQRERGAYTDTKKPLAFPGRVDTDSAGRPLDASTFETLATDLRPDDSGYLSDYVPTLFQSLSAATNTSLRSDFAMIDTESMRRAFGQGEALRELLEHAEKVRAWTIVVDLPGPDSIAFAAGLRPFCSAIFTFDNWPHPLGVVPAHLTLAAAMFHRRAFQAGSMPPAGPPAYVLDRDRLAAYVDDPQQFDNRYVAKLPTAKTLRERGVQRILYIVPMGIAPSERDDLNERFVEYRKAEIEVRMLGLDDMTLEEKPAPSPTTPTQTPSTGTTRPHYYWHGSPLTHWWFWNYYAWPSRPSGITPQQPLRNSFGAAWTPTRRNTLFAGGGNIGQTGMQSGSSGSSSSRSGSYGRSTGGWGGG